MFPKAYTEIQFISPKPCVFLQHIAQKKKGKQKNWPWWLQQQRDGWRGASLCCIFLIPNHHPTPRATGRSPPQLMILHKLKSCSPETSHHVTSIKTCPSRYSPHWELKLCNCAHLFITQSYAKWTSDLLITYWSLPGKDLGIIQTLILFWKVQNEQWITRSRGTGFLFNYNVFKRTSRRTRHMFLTHQFALRTFIMALQTRLPPCMLLVMEAWE